MCICMYIILSGVSLCYPPPLSPDLPRTSLCADSSWGPPRTFPSCRSGSEFCASEALQHVAVAVMWRSSVYLFMCVERRCWVGCVPFLRILYRLVHFMVYSLLCTCVLHMCVLSGQCELLTVCLVLLALRICGQLVHNSRKWFEIFYYGHSLCKLSTCHLRHPFSAAGGLHQSRTCAACVLVYELRACCTQSGAPALPT